MYSSELWGLLCSGAAWNGDVKWIQGWMWHFTYIRQYESRCFPPKMWCKLNGSMLLLQCKDVVKFLTLWKYSGSGKMSLRAHLVFIGIIKVVQVQNFNLMSGDKVLTPCWNELSKQGLKYQAAYMIAFWFLCVLNHNRVVAFHIMFIITTVTAH